jgi:hypothetical protein
MENKSTSSQLPTGLRQGNTDKSTIFENFNKHFSTAGHAFLLDTPTPDNSFATPAATCPSLPSFSFTQIQIADVLKELQNLEPYKSAGLDNLDHLFLKLSATIVTPLQRGDTLDPNCYRPISILPCFLKSSKAKLTNRSVTVLNPTVPSPLCNPLCNFQTGHGCTSATLKVLNDILTAIDKRQYCAAVFIDLAKAFDSVSHRILIGRLGILSAALVSQMTASSGSQTNSQIDFSVSKGLLSGPLAVSMGYHRVQFLGRLFSLYISTMSLLLRVIP